MRSNVLYWLDNTARKFPDKKAIWDERIELSFSEYRNKALAIARMISTLGLEKQPVVVYLEKSAKVLVSFAGIGYSRNFYSPIDVTMPESRVNKILEVLNPKAVITTAELRDQFAQFDYNGEYIIYEDVLIDEEDEAIVSKIQSRIIDTDLLYVLFTSGSTGVPKGVGITHRAVYDYTDWVTETFNITENDSFGNQAPFYFDNSILDIYSMMKTGAELFIIPGDLFGQPIKLLEFINDHEINTIFWVPSALMMVSRLRAFKNVDVSKTLKRVMFCGEVMPTKQLNIWRSFIPDAVYANLYGPTEITDACTYYIVDREFADDESLPIGIPMENTEVIVLDDNDNYVSPADTETVGELCVRGTGVTVGYYKNPEKTEAALVQNPLNDAYEEKIYRTGDLVRYNKYGELLYLCRKDFQIKHFGHRIELGEIETAYFSIDNVPAACCLYDEKRSKIVLFTEGEVDKEFIINELEKLVPEYMIPGKFKAIEKMPMNANGKIDRPKLKEML